MKSQLAALYAQALAENASLNDFSCASTSLPKTSLSSRPHDDDDDDDDDEDESKSCSSYESSVKTQSITVCRSSIDMTKEQSPAELLRELFPMLEEEDDSCFDDDSSFWDEMYENDRAAYNPKVVNAIRDKDLDVLYDLLNEGHSFEACNNNGEYLIHLACRRGDIETVEFLVEEAKVDVNVKDKMGRTILHDVCWRPQRDPELMSYLLRYVDPHLLLVEDNRGHTPFDYCRAHDWRLWKLFCHTQLGDILERMDL